MTSAFKQLGLAFCLLTSMTTSYAGEVNPKLCPADFLASQPKFISSNTNDQRVHITADSARVDSDAVTYFEGAVRAQQANRLLEADRIRYDRTTEDVLATGNIVYSIDNSRITGDEVEFNLNTSQGVVRNADYFTGTVNGRGHAETIDILGKTKLELNSANYTTCPTGAEAWRLDSSSIFLDNEAHQGSASNVVLRVADVPIFYFPYFRFPLSENRLSGFLYPGLAVSNKHGTEITLPYYWNIAPSMDATFTLRNMTKRGLMLENEFRYLTENGTGSIEVDYLSDDKLYGDDRGLYAWKYAGNPSAGWSTTVDYTSVSDTEYINDFSDSLASSSLTHLNRQATLNYNHENFVFSGILQNYQRLSGEQPYAKAPQLILNSRFTNQDNQLNYDVETQYVHFDHSNPTKVIGDRVVIKPFISYPLLSDPGFFIPKLSVQHMQYNLDQLSSPTDDPTPSATIPVFSTDMGVFFERDTKIADTDLLQTLEPRLFYLYAPNVEQDNLPVFDTALTTFSESLFYSENRFSGYDRVGDANQLTASLMTRFYRQDTGTEMFNAAVGQIIYFSDRVVTLPGGTSDITDRSSYITTLSFTPDSKFKILSEFYFDSELDHTEVSNSRISYQAGPRSLISYDYRFRRNELRTQGISFIWQINPGWRVFGGYENDLEHDHRLQDFFGFRYDNCCWGVRIIGHEYFDSLDTNGTAQYQSAIWLELELKGLSSLGSEKRIDSILESGILGFR